MIKIINEAEKNSAKIEKWSKKFVTDLMNDPEIKELSKLPDNEYGEKAVDLEVGTNRIGGTVIMFDSYGNGGEFEIDGFDKNGKPHFLNSNNSYEEMLNLIKNEIKQIIEDEQRFTKEREEKLAKAKEQFSKMSQEEKDDIVMNYLINKK